MTHLQATNVAFQYPQHAEPLFKNISVSFSRSTRSGLVGQNGVGKSTFCALLAGTLTPTSGRIIRSDSATVAVYSFAVLERESDLSSFFLAQDTDIYSGEFISAMSAWGIKFETLFLPLDTWSGGQKARALLAALFLSRPTFIFFDEPTNHLDQEGIEILEHNLNQAQCGYVIISHNRDFLDRNTTSTLWLEDQSLIHYGMAVSGCVQLRKFIAQKTADRKTELLKGSERFLRMQREKQQLGKSMDTFKGARSVRKNGGICQLDVGSGSSRVNTGKPMRQARRHGEKAEALALEAQVLVTKKEKIRKLNFAGSEPVVKQLLLAWDRRDINAPGSDRLVLEGLSLSIGSGQRVAFRGPNGCGKSLLLGEIHSALQAKGIKVGMLQQELPDARSLLVAEYLGDGERDLLESALNILGSMHVSGDLRNRRISSLSAGEKVKVVLAKLFALAPTVLILDEVTNHVSMIDLVAIEQALKTFSGTLIVVSHDTAFVRNLGCLSFDLVGFSKCV